MDDGSTPRPADESAATSAGPVRRVVGDGEPAAARPVRAVLSADPPRNARQVLMVLGTMAVFFVGLVIVASWAAGHG